MCHIKTYGHLPLQSHVYRIADLAFLVQQEHLLPDIAFEQRRFVDAARRTATALLPLVGEDGRLPGRFDAAWHPAARWACLTGMAQMSVVWHRLAAVGEGEHFLDAKRKVDRFLLSVHDVDSADGGLRGGVRGSYPVNGAYCRYRAPNWATKFFVDAILCSLPDFAERRFKG